MKDYLKIHVYEIDGAVHTFVQEDSDWASRALAELHPLGLFVNDRIMLRDDCCQVVFASPRVTRIDLVTNQLSVWDFPFCLGALSELTESEFVEAAQIAETTKQKSSPNGTAVYLDLQMLDGLRLYLWMQLVAGLSLDRLTKIYSIFKERRLIFGLRTEGVGILNLANLVHFSVVPECAGVAPNQLNTELKERLALLQSDTRSASFQMKQL